MQTLTSHDIKHRFSFFTGIRFEIFYALQAVTDLDSRIHSVWTKQTRKNLPKEFWKKFDALGGSPFLWPLVPDAIKEMSSSNPTFDEVVVALQALSFEKFQKRILTGVIHSTELVDEIIKKPKDIHEIIGRVPTKKREWLSFIGLYPFDESHPNAKMLFSLLQPTPAFQRNLVDALEVFWKSIFSKTWQQLQPLLNKSSAEKERLFNSCSLSEFVNQSLLRVEVDESKHVIRAARGGYEMPFKSISAAYMIPSVFNDKRYWTAYETKNGTYSYFPYFDPSIELSRQPSLPRNNFKHPELDIAFIFKALGDPTRFALMCLIAQSPKTATELAKKLGVSKPTISHHVHTLRDAGLIEENFQSGSVLLEAKLHVFEALSDLSIKKFFKNHQLPGSL